MTYTKAMTKKPKSESNISDAIYGNYEFTDMKLISKFTAFKFNELWMIITTYFSKK